MTLLGFRNYSVLTPMSVFAEVHFYIDKLLYDFAQISKVMIQFLFSIFMYFSVYGRECTFGRWSYSQRWESTNLYKWAVCICVWKELEQQPCCSSMPTTWTQWKWVVYSALFCIQHPKTSWSLYTASLATRKYGSNQTVINSDILCDGSEKKLADCFLPGVGSGGIEIAYGTCDSRSTAGVICSASEWILTLHCPFLTFWYDPQTRETVGLE